MMLDAANERNVRGKGESTWDPTYMGQIIWLENSIYIIDDTLYNSRL